jgi:Outer membrane protein beta-barrel domain
MGSRSRLLRVASFVAACIGANASAGSETGFYFGAGAGGSNVSVTDWNNNGHNDCCDYYYQDGDGDTAFVGHVGYRFLPYLAVEVGYLDSGNPRWNENGVFIGELGDFFNLSVDLKKLEATQVSVLGILPFASIWEAYVRGGVAYWSADADQTAIGTFNGALFRRSVNKSDAGFLFGVGIGATPLPHWHFRVEVQTYSIDQDLLGGYGDASVDSALFEAEYRFGK